jgi:hypothetical protein
MLFWVWDTETLEFSSQEIDVLIAKQKELQKQESWILSKKSHTKQFGSRKQRDLWLGSELKKTEEELRGVEARLEEMRHLQAEQQDLLTSTVAALCQKSQEHQDVLER